MKKHIRPLTAFKKANPLLYKILSYDLTSTSEKGKENEIYWNYAYWELNTNSNMPKRPDEFYWKDYNNKNNIGTTTEMGRLLLTCWYYDIELFGKKICSYVYNSWRRKVNKNEKFNDLEFQKLVKHIRENLDYYYHNENELKLYILKNMFNDELQQYLPEPPEELKNYKKAIELITAQHKARIKKDKDWYVNNYAILEEYIDYLQEQLDGYGITYKDLNDFEKDRNEKNKEFHRHINQIQENYKSQIMDVKQLPGYNIENFIQNGQMSEMNKN